jgi:hypothetical protein
MLLALVLQVAAPQTAVEAERAFASAAQTEGQWTAFRKFAAGDAIMFVPQPTDAQAWLKDRKDPPKAIEWWPTESYESCDGAVAINTGGWKRPDGSVGYFTTIWHKQADGSWKWSLDHGDALAKPRPKPRKPRRAKGSCAPVLMSTTPTLPEPGVKGTGGDSRDRSLHWAWQVTATGARSFSASLWDGRDYIRVISDEVAPPK